MNCEELQRELSNYVDDRLAAAARLACNEHLLRCPVCRQRLAETRRLLRNLSLLSRPEPPAGFSAAIQDALLIEAGARARQPLLPPHLLVFKWLQPRLMPYTVGAFTSVLLFIFLSTALVPNMRVLRELENNPQEAFRNLGGFGPFDVTLPVTPEVYALSREQFSSESPSLNPKGGLAALAWSRAHELTADDEMMIVADVFSNGSAALADVVVAPRNRRMLDDVQRAFRSSRAFVPASLDHRPQTMRVVLTFQRMDVRDQDF